MAPGRIKPLLDLAVRRFHAFARLQGELDEARGALAERAAIDKAKRILMDTRGLPEPAAYAQLRSHAMRTGKRIVEVAEALILAQDMIGDGA